MLFFGILRFHLQVIECSYDYIQFWKRFLLFDFILDVNLLEQPITCYFFKFITWWHHHLICRVQTPLSVEWCALNLWSPVKVRTSLVKTCRSAFRIHETWKKKSWLWNWFKSSTNIGLTTLILVKQSQDKKLRGHHFWWEKFWSTQQNLNPRYIS
jgi:hypothetical protein